VDRSQAKVDTAKAAGATGPKAYLSLKVSHRECWFYMFQACFVVPGGSCTCLGCRLRVV